MRLTLASRMGKLAEIMEEKLERIEIAVRHDQRDVALQLLEEVRNEAGVLVAMRATVENALIELDGSTDHQALIRFVSRVRAAFDPDLDK